VTARGPTRRTDAQTGGGERPSLSAAALFPGTVAAGRWFAILLWTLRLPQLGRSRKALARACRIEIPESTLIGYDSWKGATMIELTEAQRQELSAAEPIAVDPGTGETYVLVRKDIYDRIKGLLYDNGEWTEQELRLLLARSAEANGWNEPNMDDYDHYDANRAKQCRHSAET
jgi:hypothetical protein